MNLKQVESTLQCVKSAAVDDVCEEENILKLRIKLFIYSRNVVLYVGFPENKILNGYFRDTSSRRNFEFMMPRLKRQKHSAVIETFKYLSNNESFTSRL